MFVRLFVDENLDRMVPISKQPKEKIQAIIDSCTRQFPEFAERARKRIRTYLKSCRRNKKVRDGWDATVRGVPITPYNDFAIQSIRQHNVRVPCPFLAAPSHTSPSNLGAGRTDSGTGL